MKDNYENAGQPFAIIAGEGLGYSQEGNQTTASLPHRAFGQAKLNYAVNVATGNLVAQDRLVSIPDVGGPIELSYIYNSVASAWKLNAVKRIQPIVNNSYFAGLTSFFTTQTSSITLINADGREIKYSLDKEGWYYSSDNDYRIKYDADKKQFTGYDFQSRVTEIYDEKGYLTKKLDASGCETNYIYDEVTGELKEIISPSGIQYKIEREKETVSLLRVDKQKNRTLLHTYQFEKGNLKTSTTADGYKTEYEYDSKHGKLKRTYQSDKSELRFSYDSNGSKLQTLHIGNEEFKNHKQIFNYEGNQSRYTDAVGNQTTFKLTAKKQLQELIQKNNNEAGLEQEDKIHYEYTSTGKISKIIYPDQSEDNFEYEAKSDLLIKHIKRDKTSLVNIYERDEKTNHYSLIAAKNFPANSETPLRTKRFVYANTGKNGGAVLRFEISPEGRVKEYVYTEDGLIESEHTYPDTKDICLFTEELITLEKMEQWKQNDGRLGRRTFTRHYYDDNRKLTKTVHFANVDEKLGGLESENNPENKYEYDQLNRLTSASTKQLNHAGSCNYIKSLCRYNDNGDIVEKIEGYESKLSQTTRHVYESNNITTLYANGRVEKRELDSSQLLNKITSTVLDEKKEKTTSFIRDDNGQVSAIVLADSNKITSIYDKQNRLRFSITPEHAVTQFDYNRQFRYQVKTEYATQIDPAKINSLGYLDDLALSVDPFQDRISYTFFDLNDEIRFSIDAENFIVERQYDLLGNLIKIIRYTEKLSDVELEDLKLGKELARKADRTRDQIESYFYDLDGNKIAEQNPAGYVTRFERDGSGRITQKIQYSTPCLKETTQFSEVIPPESLEKDAHTHYFYNSLNQCVLEMDAEGYLTRHDYFPDGQKQCSIRYEYKAENDWQSKGAVPVPKESKYGNDQTTNYLYDEIGRLIEVKTSNGEVVTFAYDEMNRRTMQCHSDAITPMTLDNIGDVYRNSESKYDGWGQVIAESDPIVMAQIKKLSLSNLSEEEKTALRNKIWQDHSKKHQYNEVGYRIKSTDQLGHNTFYYYDKDGNLALEIDPTGAVIENVYNAFKEIIEERRFYHRLTPENILKLTGGTITADTLNLIQKDPNKDVITTFHRDRRGLVTKKTDPELFVSKFSYNAFKQCDCEILPVANNLSTMEVKHEYDVCNNEVKTITTASDISTNDTEVMDSKLGQIQILENHFGGPKEKKRGGPESTPTIVIEKKYDHFLGKQTETTNEVGGRTKQQFDRLGRLKKIEKEVNKDRFIVDKELNYDAFSQITQLTNADNAVTTIEYNQANRTQTICSPIAESKEIISTNIFNQTIEKTDGVGNQESIRHAANGEVTTHKIGDHLTTTQYNLAGLKEEEIDAAKTKTQFQHNKAKQLTKIIKDADDKGLNLTTTFEPNALGQNEKVINAKNVETKNEFNRAGHLVKTIVDTAKEQLTVQTIRNAQGNETSRLVGDDKTPDQMHLATEHDFRGLVTAEIIDPATLTRDSHLPMALDLRTAFVRDKAGNIVKVTNPNGSITRHYYDLLNRKTFEIKSINASQCQLKEWTYTSTGKIACVRSYYKPVDAKLISDETNVDEIKQPDNQNDSINLFYYDQKGREKFNVVIVWNAILKKYEGILVENQYDHADKLISKISYAAALDANDFTTWNTDKVTILAASIANSTNDRIVTYRYDEKNQLRFTIDNDGLTLENQYDSAGRVIAEVSYATTFKQSKFKSCRELSSEAKEKSSPARDRISYRVYDAVGREIFYINPVGVVTRKDYDENDNVLRVCQFKKTVSVDLSYENLVTEVKSLVPDRTKDSIIETEYNSLDHIKNITDERGYKDIYRRNVLGMLAVHIDREKNQTNYYYDRAKRLIEEVSPAVKIALVNRNDKGKLSVTEKISRVTKKIDYDNAGNTACVTDGIIEGVNDQEKLAQARIVNMRHDHQNHVLETSVPNVSVDDKEKIGSLTNLPEKQGSIVTRIVWNTRNLKTVETNESGISVFHVYDNIGRLIYQIDGEQYVTEYHYNNFKQPIKIIKYATKLDNNLSATVETGLTTDLVTDMLQNKKSSEDRIQVINYDRSGRLTNVKTGAVFYYSDGQAGLAQPETKKEFNLLGDCTVESRLIRPGVWSKKFTWYDQCERIIAEVDENNYLTRYQYNSQGKVELKTEYAKALPFTPTINLLVDELYSYAEPAKEDRNYQYQYDLSGQKISETLLGVTIEELVLDEKTSVPSLNSIKLDLKRAWEYSPTQRETKVIHEDGSSERKYYDGRGTKIAETQVSRQSMDDEGKRIILTPLITITPNAFGQEAVSQTTMQGGTLPDEKGTVPTLISTGPEDLVQEIALHDQRGLVKLKQDAEENLTGFTYTPTRKIAREINEVSQWNKIETKEVKQPSIPTVAFEKDKHIDEKQFNYDGCDRSIQLTLLRDSKVEEKSFSRFNAFSELTGESADGQTWEMFIKKDPQGNSWFAQNENGGMLKLHDLRGAETLQLQSTDEDLSGLNYDAAVLNNLLSKESKSLERTETIRDSASHVIARKFPIWFRDKKPIPTRAFEYDRWANITKERDSFNNVTEYEHNHRDQVRKRTQPEVVVAEVVGDKLVYDDKGEFPRKKPVTFYGHNARGSKIGVKDANGHTRGYLLDEASQLVSRVYADGTKDKTNVFNAHGLLTTAIDSQGKRWRYQYDRRSNITAETYPISNENRLYEYNEANQRSSDKDAKGNAVRYNYDVRGNINERYLPLGQCTRTEWDRNAQPVRVLNPDGDSMSWKRDYFGSVLEFNDLDNRKYIYEHNYNKRIQRQYLVTGMQWNAVDLQRNTTFIPEDGAHEFPVNVFTPSLVGCRSQNVYFNYANGVLEQVVDVGLSKITNYQCDSESRPVNKEIRNFSNDLLYHVTADFDAIGRETLITEERKTPHTLFSSMKSTLLYDAVDNRRNIKMTVIPSGYAADCKMPPLISDHWNLFDDADRVKLSAGVVSLDGRIQLAPSRGLALKHENGLRTQEVSVNAEGGSVVSDIHYDDNRRLKSSISPGVQTESSYGDAGCPDTYRETANGQTTEQKAIFNDNNWIQEEITTDPVNGNSIRRVTEFFQQGLSKTEVIIDAKLGTTEERQNEYLRTNGWSLNKTTVTCSGPSGKSAPSSAEFGHDANGTLNGKINSVDELAGTVTPTISIDTTHDGALLSKQAIAGGQLLKEANYMSSLNGELLGGYTCDHVDAKSYTNQLVMLKATFDQHPQNFSMLETLLQNGKIPYSDGVVIFGSGTKAVYFFNKKLMREASGKVLIKTPHPSQTDLAHLKERSLLPGFPCTLIDRAVNAPELFDRVINVALAQIGHNQNDMMQLQHFANHKKGLGHDVRPVVSNIVPYPSIHPIARTTPTDKKAKNNPLGWDEPTVMQQLGVQTYIVKPGDTFRSIAKGFGDRYVANRIARSNGFPNGSHAPKAGMILRIPQIIPSKAKAGTSRPDQDFMRVIAGSLSPAVIASITPHRSAAPVHKKKHQSIWHSLIKIIAVAIACAVAPHLAPMLIPFLEVGGILSTATATAVATGVCAAIGDAAAQGLAIGLGAQQKFSFAEMLETGVTGGVGATLAEANNLPKLAMNALKIGTAAVGTQLAEMATGLRSKFDAAAIATQVSAFVVSAKINDGIDGILEAKTTLSNATKTAANTVSSALLGKGITHTPIDVQSLVANAIGSHIGNEVSTKLNNKLDSLLPPPPKSKPQHQTASDELQIEIPSIPSTDIDITDPTWKHQMTDMASRQRQERNNAIPEEKGHSYLLDPDRQQKYKNMMFSERKGNEKISVNSASHEKQRAQPSRSYSFSKNDLYDAIDAFNPLMIPAFADRAYNEFRSGDIIHGINSSCGAAFGVISGLATGVEQLAARGGAALAASLSRGLGMFGRSSRVRQEFSALGSTNHINGLRLQRQLNIEQASSIFDKRGYLTDNAIKNSRLIMPGEEIGNQYLRKELIVRGGNLADWGKYSSRPLVSPSGNFEVHFYHNPVTRDVYYGRDYKSIFQHQGRWNLEPGPKFTYLSPRIRN